MSTELGKINTESGNPHGINLTQFFGGTGRGTCIQLTMLLDGEWRYIQLTKADAAKLSKRLAKWAAKP